MKKLLLGIVMSTLLASTAFSATTYNAPRAPQPTSCILAKFSSNGNAHWKTMSLKLTNNCGKSVNFQNAAIAFQTRTAINSDLWGNFAPLSYPDNKLRISSQRNEAQNFTASFNLHFPTYPGSNSNLPANNSITLHYGVERDTHLDGTVNVYLDTPVATGSIQLNNASSQPAQVTQAYSVVHITMNGQKISDPQVPWGSTQTLSGLAPGNYALTADNLNDSSGNTYQGSVTPAAINLLTGQTAKAIINYSLVQQTGKLAIQLQALPVDLTGYTSKPTVLVTQTNSSSSVPVILTWNSSTTVTQLKNGASYQFSTPAINYNNVTCQPSFSPASLLASATTLPSTSLTYNCNPVAQSKVSLQVNGAPTNLSSLKVTLTPNNNTAAVSQNISLSNGSGSSIVTLPTGTIYNVSSDSVTGYTVNFNPQPLTATANAIETISLAPSQGTPVAVNGQLHVCGNKLCNQQGQAIQLKGMSTHGIQWYGLNQCLTQASLDTLAKDFNASVMRISLYVQEGGYETDPAGFTQQVNQLIAEASKRGIYAIVDWHILTPGDPNVNLSKAKKFFTDIATANKGRNNLFYEIANEPNGVNWSSIKSYADQLIPVIRAIDPTTIIIVGTPGWSSLGVSDGRSSQDIINQPVNFSNVMYSFHFYAASHGADYLNELNKASDSLPIFVTEYGTQTYSGGGANDFVMSEQYLQLMAQKKISWTNWNYSDDELSGAIWKTGTCSAGPWTDNQLKQAGVWVKAKIKG